MTNLIQFLILFVVASVQCNNAHQRRLPFIEMIPTGAIPQICVTAREDLPPCGIGKFIQNQRDYEAKINKIRQSYVDMLIDYKYPKNGSIENYGPGKIYLESFESLNRQLEEEERKKKLMKNNSSEIGEEHINLTKMSSPEIDIPNEADTIDTSDFEEQDIIEPPIIRIIRVVRSLEKTIIVATECIPLGVEFCDNFPRPTAYEENILKKRQRRSPQTFQDYLKYFWNIVPKREKKLEYKSSSAIDDLRKIVPLNKHFFDIVHTRSILDEVNRINNDNNDNKLTNLAADLQIKSLEIYDAIEEFQKLFGAKIYKPEDTPKKERRILQKLK